MTREERLAAGWLERWAVRYAKGSLWIKDADYCCGGTKSQRRLYPNERSARMVADKIVYGPVEVVTVWVRKKPEQKPPLKVGDTVTVRATIEDHGPKGYWVRVSPSIAFWVETYLVEKWP